MNWLKRAVQVWRDYPLENGTIIGGGYRIVRHLGTGGYGLVYEAVQLNTGRRVALKCPKPSKMEGSVRRLEREIRVLSQARHPQIAGYIEHFTDKKRLWLVQEYVEGPNVELLIFGEGRRFTEAESLEWTLQVFRIAADLHRKGIVHLDIRIPNVIMVEGAPVLLDFGFARMIGESDPEDVAAKPSAPASDYVDLGHYLLFLLYSAYPEQEESSSAVWQEELRLAPGTRRTVESLLNAHEVPISETDLLAMLHEAIEEARELRR